jgi:serpin B
MDSKRLRILVSAVLIAFGVVVVFAGIRMFEKKNNSEEEKETYKPNDVNIDGFTYSFLKLETKNENIIYSPLSIKYALFMLKDGANGNTLEELDSLIGNLSLTKYENIDKILSLANSIFVRNTYKEYILDDYVNKLKDSYNAEVFYDEFKDASNINNWIAKKTFNIIKNMLTDENVRDKNLKVSLVNALAIDMEWLEKFKNENTGSETFTKENGEEIVTAMMHHTTKSSEFKYTDADDFKMVSMPLNDYSGTQLEFVAIMPENVTLKDFITSDSFESDLENLLNNMTILSDRKLSISIPKFEYNYKIELKKDLEKLGIHDAFIDKVADFSNMSKSELFVGQVLHKADIKFSEEGIKAAAATVIMMKDNAMFEEPEEITYLRFDKPFMYVIRDKNTNEVWFTGAVYEPVLWEKVKSDYKYR